MKTTTLKIRLSLSILIIPGNVDWMKWFIGRKWNATFALSRDASLRDLNVMAI